MATELKNVKGKGEALEASLSLLPRQRGYGADTRRLVQMESDGVTKRYFTDTTRMADQTGVYGSALIGTPGITGVTPDGGASGAAATLKAMLAGLKAYSDSALVAGLGGTTGTLLKKTGSGAAGDSILAEASGKINFSGDTVANLYRSGAGMLQSDGGLTLGANGLTLLGEILSSGGGLFSGSIECGGSVKGAGVRSTSYFATPILTTAASTLTLGNHHVVRTTHASPNITLPDSTTKAAGTEYYVFTYGNGLTFTGNGTDVWRGLNRDLGLGIEDDPDPVTYTAPRKGFMLKTSGAGHWYIWELE